MKSILLATAVLAVTASFALAQGVVRLGTEGAYPPYNFINDSGAVEGFDIDVGNEVCKRAALNCEWVTNEWDSIIPNLVSGNYDAIIAGMSITDEREEVIDFSTKYSQPDPSSFVGLSDDLDIADAVIAAQAGTIQASYIAEIGATLVEFASPDETVAAVRNGEVDAVLADKSFLDKIQAEDADLMFIGEDVLLGGGLGIGVRESDGELKAKLDAAIDSMVADGTLNDLIDQWLPGSAKF